MAAVALPQARLAIARSPGFWRSVLARLGRDPVALAALGVVVALLLTAIFAPYLPPTIRRRPA